MKTKYQNFPRKHFKSGKNTDITVNLIENFKKI